MIRVKGTWKEGIWLDLRRAVRKVQVRPSSTTSWDEVEVRRVRKEGQEEGEREREMYVEDDGQREERESERNGA